MNLAAVAVLVRLFVAAGGVTDDRAIEHATAAARHWKRRYWRLRKRMKDGDEWKET